MFSVHRPSNGPPETLTDDQFDPLLVNNKGEACNWLSMSEQEFDSNRLFLKEADGNLPPANPGFLALRLKNFRE